MAVSALFRMVVLLGMLFLVLTHEQWQTVESHEIPVHVSRRHKDTFNAEF